VCECRIATTCLLEGKRLRSPELCNDHSLSTDDFQCVFSSKSSCFATPPNSRATLWIQQRRSSLAIHFSYRLALMEWIPLSRRLVRPHEKFAESTLFRQWPLPSLPPVGRRPKLHHYTPSTRSFLKHILERIERVKKKPIAKLCN